jgi:hypothetical protein
MAEATIAGYGNTFSLRPNRLGGCYNCRGNFPWLPLLEFGAGTGALPLRKINRPLAKVDKSYQIHLSLSVFICVHLWLKIKNKHFCKRSNVSGITEPAL